MANLNISNPNNSISAAALGTANNPVKNANAARPSGLTKVFWQCTTQPVNWVDGDEWIDSDAVSSGGTVTDATTTTKGVIQLTGDLGGTAATPTTPTAVHLTGTETITGAKTFQNSQTTFIGNALIQDAATPTKSYRMRTSGTGLDFDASGADMYLSVYSGAGFTGTQRQYIQMVAASSAMVFFSSFYPNTTATTTVGTSTRYWAAMYSNRYYLNATAYLDGTTAGVITANNNRLASIADPTAAQDAATKNYVDTANATKQATLVSGTNIKTINGTTLLGSGDITITSSGTTPDATTTTKGIVQLAGDLGGTAAAPTVPTKLSLTGGTMTGNLSVTADNGRVTIKNTNSGQYNGSSMAILNSPTTMGNQAGAMLFSGISDTGATKGYFAVDKVDSNGSSGSHLLFFDYDANTVTSSLTLSMSNLKVTNLQDPTALQDAATKNYVDTVAATKANDINTVHSGSVDNVEVVSSMPGSPDPNTLYVVQGSAAIVDPPVVLTDAATITTNASLGNYFRITITGDRTLAAPTNPADGQRVMWEITASGANRAITLTTGTGGFQFGTDIVVLPGSGVISSGTTMLMGAIYHATKARWLVVAATSGY